MNNKEVILVMISGIETQLQTLKNLVYASEKSHSEPTKPVRQEKLEETYLSEEEERQLEQKIEKEHRELLEAQPEVEEEMARMRSIFDQADARLLKNPQQTHPATLNPVSQPHMPHPAQLQWVNDQSKGPNMHEQMGDFEGFMQNLGN